MNEGGKGWLDYIALRPPRIIVVELKDDYTKMTPEQEEWFYMWRKCEMYNSNGELLNPELYLFRPKQIDEIAVILK